MLCAILREYQHTSHRYAQRLRMPDILLEESQPLNPPGDLPCFMSFGLKPEGKTPLIRKIRRAMHGAILIYRMIHHRNFFSQTDAKQSYVVEYFRVMVDTV